LGRPAAAAPRARFDELARFLRAGGVDVTVVDDPWPAVWRKVVTNAAVNPLTALIRRTNADLLADAPASRVADSLAREVARVATASGVRIDEDEAVKQWRTMAALTGANRSSMLQDVEAGRPTELDAICGAVAREGEGHGRDAPLRPAGTAPTPKPGVGGSIFLRPDGQSDPPQGMRADKIWLLNGAESWETVPQPLQTFAADRRNHLSLSVRDGPTWDTSAKVDVVLRFSTASGTYFVQQRSVQIIGAL